MITLDYKYTDLNTYIYAERSHRIKAAKIKREEGYVTELLLRGVAPITTPTGLRFIWYQTSKRKDLDNISFGAKVILDSMVKAGIIPNDNLNHITKLVHEVRFSDKEYVTIEVLE